MSRGAGATLSAALAGAVLLLVCLLWGPRFTPYSTLSPDFTAMGVGPSGTHPCGTYSIGLDLCAAILAGTRVQASLAGQSLGLAAVFGGLLGIAARLGPTRMRATILTCAHTLGEIPPLVLPTVLVGLAVLPSEFFWPTDWVPVTTLALITWPAFTLLVYALMKDHWDMPLSLPWQTMHVIALRLILATLGTVVGITWLGLAGIGPMPPSPGWGVLLHVAFTDPTGGFPPSFMWWMFVFPVGAVCIAAVTLWLLARFLRLLLLLNTPGPALWEQLLLYEPQTFWLLRPSVTTDATMACLLCGQRNVASRQYCGGCHSPLVQAPVDAGLHVRPLWQVAVFMVLSFGLYVVPWCYRACRFTNTLWAVKGSPRHRMPIVWCLLLLVPLVNCYVIYRLAADIEDTTGVRGPPAAATLAAVYLFSFLALPLSPPFGAFGALLGLAGRTGCLLSMQERIHFFFKQDNPEAARDWELGWPAALGCITGLGAWVAVGLELFR